MTFSATADLGKSFSAFSMWGAFKEDPRGKLSTHHVSPVYCVDTSGRFLALGDNRGQGGTKFGHLFASDDQGKTWQWIMPKGLEACASRGTMVSNGQLLLMTDKDAEQAWTSTDVGQTWTGPHPTGTKRATLSCVGKEFWLTGKPSRASADGVTWRSLPDTVPSGKIATSDKGTLVCVDVKRGDILRSADGGQSWQTVYQFEMEKIEGGAQGLRAIEWGLVAP